MTERDDFDSKTGMTIDELSLTMCMKDMDEIWVSILNPTLVYLSLSLFTRIDQLSTMPILILP